MSVDQEQESTGDSKWVLEIDESKVPTWAKEMIFVRPGEFRTGKGLGSGPEIYDLIAQGVVEDPPVYYDLSLKSEAWRASYTRVFQH